MSAKKPEIVKQIEQILGESFELHPPKHDTIRGLMGINYPKYAFEGNRLIGLNLAETKLNDTKWQAIVDLLDGQFGHIQALNISYNQLTEFILPVGMKELHTLDISDNRITEFAMSAGMDNLVDLNLHGNPLISPPPDVIRQGKNEILKWLRAENKRPVLEAKVMFIGDSSYGKTHLIEMLRHERIKREIKTTHGIERNCIKDAPSPEGPIQLNVWDLGGQEFMRSTHQFFFTERTLYVLVTVARRERKDLNHWLELVHEIGADAPVLMVINKIDLDEHDIDREPLQRDYPNIVGFVRTAVFNNKETGIVALDTIKNLEVEIHRIVADRKLMPSVFVEQRPEWFTVKKELETMKEDYISYEKYKELPYINKLSGEEQFLNLKQLASLGTVVSFVDDPRLADTNVINPKWITDGVYCLINDPKIKDERRGEFSFADFKRLLDSKRYPATKYSFLVDLMEKFKLCYPVRDRKNSFLFPDLFVDIEPEGVWPKNNDVMRFRLNYGSYPPDLFITQFIVERYTDILDEKRWRSGVVVSDDRCKAIIRRSFKNEYIEIEVAGPENERRGYLHTLLDVFRRLHQPFEKLKPIREVYYKKFWLNYDHLLTYEEEGKPYYHPELREDIPVSEVLDGYGRPGVDHYQDKILEDLEIIKKRQFVYQKENEVGITRVEKKVNRIHRQVISLSSDFNKIVGKKVDMNKLEDHFDEVKNLINDVLQSPELERIPVLEEKLQEWKSELSDKKLSGNSIKIVGSLLPSIVQEVYPLIPNIEYEVDGATIIELFKRLAQSFKKVSNLT